MGPRRIDLYTKVKGAHSLTHTHTEVQSTAHTCMYTYLLEVPRLHSASVKAEESAELYFSIAAATTL